MLLLGLRGLGFETRREFGIGFLKAHLLGQIPAFLLEWIPWMNRPETMINGGPASVGFEKMGGLRNLCVDPLLQVHRSNAVAAGPDCFAIGIEGGRRAVVQ